MPSREILDKLFDVERRAEALVSEAQTEAMRRAAQAKEAAESGFKKTYETAAREMETKRSEVQAATDAECRAALDEYRAHLGSVRLDTESFRSSCDTIIAGMF
jgi:F0F1-type ATP synthase membrane subunit b/b'